ncbi:MAG: glycine cleavage system protein H, partial [Spirochaetaceae bacterium]
MSEMKFAETHEWIQEQGGIGTCGITDFAQHQLTDIVFVELPPVGRTLAKGERAAV